MEDGDTEAWRRDLRALGYVDYASEAAASAERGVTRRDPMRSAPGVNLVTYPGLRRVDLVDASGEILWSWSRPGRRWERAELLPGGEIVVVRPPGAVRISRDGRVLTRWRQPVHHRFSPIGRERFLSLTIRRRSLPDGRSIFDNGIAIFSAGGALLSELSLWEAVTARPDLLPLSPTVPLVDLGEEGLDLFHANFADWIADRPFAERWPFERCRCALVTLRHQDAIALVDLDRGELVWAWGRDELAQPHDAAALANGHILVFDNRSGEGASRVVELDPASGKIVWQYRAPRPADFYSASRGTVQRLRNGNTLIGESNRGRIFEVTPAGEIVWEYRTPHLSEEGRAAALRVSRYAERLAAPFRRE